MAKKLTKRTVDALLSTSPRGTWYADSDLPGFFVVVYPTGAKVFFARFRVGSARKVVRIGRFGVVTVDEARVKAREVLSQATLGGDPSADRERSRKMPSFRAWAETYLERVRRVKKHPKDDERFLPMAFDRWGSRPLDQITSEDVEAFRQSLKRTPTQANRWLASVRACFSAAVRATHIRTNPAKGLALYRENPPRARVLTPEELERLLRVVEEEEDPFVRAAFRLLVETGARLSEVRHAKWEDLDFAGGTWRIPSPKSGRPQIVPLPSTTAAVLRKLPKVGPYVVPGQNPGRPRADLRKPWDRIRTAASLPPDVHIHDLRRTFGLAVAREAGLHVASKLLRHADVRVTERVYAPLGLEDLRAAVERRAAVLPFPPEKSKVNR